MSTVAQISIEQYDRMIERGVFDGPHRKRIELIYGELRMMSPIGPSHEDAVDELNVWSIQSVPADDVRVRSQESVGVPALESVPEPDVSWVKYRRYSESRPTAKDVLLLIEVARSSLKYDLGKKAVLYAKARIADYWVVDLKHRCVVVMRDPYRGRHRDVTTYEVGEAVHSLAYPKIKLEVARLFS